jgi:pilus assembly protein Flp/PilA
VNHPTLKKLPLSRCAAHPARRRTNAIAPVLRHLLHDDSGQDLIEYALVAALVGLGAVTALRSLTNSIGNSFNKIGTTLAAS